MPCSLRGLLMLCVQSAWPSLPVLFLWAVLGGFMQRLGVCVRVQSSVRCVYTPSPVCAHPLLTHQKHNAFCTSPELPSPAPWGVHTDGLAVLGQRVHLVARVALALKVALVVDTDLAAGVRVLALVDVCGEGRGSGLAGGWASAWGPRGGPHRRRSSGPGAGSLRGRCTQSRS